MGAQVDQGQRTIQHRVQDRRLSSSRSCMGGQNQLLLFNDGRPSVPPQTAMRSVGMFSLIACSLPERFSANSKETELETTHSSTIFFQTFPLSGFFMSSLDTLLSTFAAPFIAILLAFSGVYLRSEALWFARRVEEDAAPSSSFGAALSSLSPRRARNSYMARSRRPSGGKSIGGSVHYSADFDGPLGGLWTYRMELSSVIHIEDGWAVLESERERSKQGC